jgi:hypothetical protein
MNYIKQINGFWAKAENADITGIDIAVYMALLKYCNALNWHNPFICHWEIICQYAKVSKNTYYKSIERLAMLGFVEYKKGQRNKLSPKIVILNFENNKGTIREQREEQHEEQNEEQKGSLYKQVNKKTIKVDKIEELKNELQKYTSSYPTQMLDEFFNYWSGKDKPTSRKTRIESQSTFDYNLRLATWFRNKNDFKIDYLAKRLLEDDKYKSNFLSLYPSLDYKTKITEFYNQRLSTGKLEDSFKGFCEHFFSWVRASVQK